MNIEAEAIKGVIENAYIEGIHGSVDEDIVKSGFHEDFTMLVLQDGKMNKVGIDTWLERLWANKVNNPNAPSPETTHQFEFVDVTGHTAAVKLQVFRDGNLFATDYMFLYKFDDGWKIVSKVFTFPS